MAPSTAPKPDRIVHYVAYSSPNGTANGALCVFGDASSPKVALLCAGFPDDHTVFLPFAKALSEHGIFCGVMCLPGFDDRPEDGIPWQSHPPGGFSFDETAKTVREASKALMGISQHDNPEFTGIFHDWGVIPGSMWAQRLEEEARDALLSSSDTRRGLRPHKMVFFDVLIAPSPSMPDFIPISAVPRPPLRQVLYFLYQALFALCSVLQQYLSRRLAASVCAVGFSILIASGNSPVHLFDLRSTQALYGDRKPSLLRCMTMTYMYRNLFSECLSSRTFPPWYLHEDWKATPILYLYGKKKNAMYHSTNCLAMLEREQAERRSLSRVVSLEGAGHFLYVQKHDECLKHVLAFLEAENTFSS